MNFSDDITLIKRGLYEHIKTKNTPQYFLNTLKKYDFSQLFRDGSEKLYSDDLICGLCETIFDGLIEERLLGADREFFVEEVVFICDILKVENDRVCSGIIEHNLVSYLLIKFAKKLALYTLHRKNG